MSGAAQVYCCMSFCRAMPDCIAALPQSAASTPMLSQQAEPSSAQLPVPSHSAIHHAQPAAVPAQPAAMPPQSTAHHAQPAAVPAQPAAPPAHSVAPSAQYVICSAQPVAPSVQLVASSAPSTAPPAQHVTSGPSPQGGPLVAPAMKGPHQLVQPHMSAAVLQHEGMPEIALSGNTAAVAQEQNLR